MRGTIWRTGGLAILAAVLTGEPAAAETPCETAGDPTPGQAAPGAADPAPGTPDRRELPASRGATEAGHAGAGQQVGDPAWPRPPDVVIRDEQGQVTIRAIKLAAGLRLDGLLDEPLYDCVRAIGNFIQLMPDEGAPATEKTEAWIAFDAESIYISARVWDSAPPAEWVSNEMRRDTIQLRDNDGFWVVLDTFHDRRNGLGFYTNPLGALGDFEISNEGNPNSDWNPVWDVRTGRFDGGWTVEMEIPFKSLRYRPGPAQVWGVQLRRNIRRKNELVFLTPLPISAGRTGIFRVSQAATLVGLEVPAEGGRLEIKPYGIAGLTTDLAATPPRRNAGEGAGGLDVKYGLTQNLTADLTYNTDFVQVEVDEQQVNLTRFSLFFPEKRELFLEAQGIFNFARGAADNNLLATGLRQIGGGDRRAEGPGNAPTLFYSRRIGLEGGAVVPIVGGGRVTGKVGDFDVGALNIQTDDEQISGALPTNFTVVRIKRDILRRSSVGALVTSRSVSVAGDGSNQAYGADATFSFYDNVNFLGYIARTRTPGLEGDDRSYQGQFIYAADRYGCRRSTWSSRRTSSPRWAFSAATTSGARTPRRGSAPGRTPSRRSGSSASRAASSATTSGCGGSTRPAASCSWCTPTSASPTRSVRTAPTGCAAGGWW